MSVLYTAMIGPVHILSPEMDRVENDKWTEAVEQWIYEGCTPDQIGPPDRPFGLNRQEAEELIEDHEDKIAALKKILHQRRKTIRKLIARKNPRPAKAG